MEPFVVTMETCAVVCPCRLKQAISKMSACVERLREETFRYECMCVSEIVSALIRGGGTC